MRVTFHRDRDFYPPGIANMVVAYKGGSSYTVKRAWAQAMIADGDCFEVPPPRRRRRAAA